MKSVAVVPAKGLGDALLYMIMSHNLASSGCEVVTFNNNLYELRSWFPGKNILPSPSLEKIEKELSAFDLVIASDHSIANALKVKQLILLEERRFNKKKTMVDNLVDVCKKQLNLPQATVFNGITAPSEIKIKSFPQRVAIHPTSTEFKRNWPKEKFIKVARLLLKEGFQPAICVALFERDEWESLLANEIGISFPLFPTLESFASYVAESGYMIGNNSGIGHLSSNLGLPTLSLFARKSYAHLWRPGWGNNRVICPPPLLFGASLKQKYWKQLLSVSRVHRAFKKL